MTEIIGEVSIITKTDEQGEILLHQSQEKFWQECTTTDGTSYFYNISTGETSWVNPTKANRAY